jgi:preprotein translocase subunit SecE
LTEEGEVAIRKRRGDDAVDERLDEGLDEDALAQDDLVEDDEEELLDEEDLLDEDELVDEDEELDEPTTKRGRRGTVATRPDSAVRGKKTGPGRKTKVRESDRPGIFGRLVNFVREVVAELRKVIWPTRKELLTYTAVVVVFVTIVTSVVAGLDYGFAKLVLLVFGNKPK